jgi:hypothetical protein
LPADYDWSALIEDWQIHLETVAYEFSQGSARLSYGIEAPSSAKLVDQVFAFSGARGFCRVYESSNTKFNASSSSENNEV